MRRLMFNQHGFLLYSVFIHMWLCMRKHNYKFVMHTEILPIVLGKAIVTVNVARYRRIIIFAFCGDILCSE